LTCKLKGGSLRELEHGEMGLEVEESQEGIGRVGKKSDILSGFYCGLDSKGSVLLPMVEEEGGG
jgi:hypothetical protein